MDDGTGDLEFDVTVSGNVINVAWVSYAKENPSPSSDERESFRIAAKNTVVKQASYDTDKKSGFSKAVTLNEAGAAVYNPTIIDDTHTAFVKANHVDEARRKKLLDEYEKKLNSFGYSKDSQNESTRNIFNFRMDNYENIIDYKGESSVLCVYSSDTGLTEFKNRGGSKSGYSSGEKTPVIDKLEGIPALGEDSAFYMAYTVWDEDLANEDKKKDGQHNSALFLADFEQSSSAVVSHYGQRKVVSDSLMGTDGAGEHLMIDTLDFFRKKSFQDIHKVLDDNVLIVGQGEHLYTMDYENLRLCLEGKGDMGAEPLTGTTFYGGEIGNDKRTGFTFGEDADGNLVTVYVSSVPDTTNTALFLSTYDGKNKTWGKGVILAMRHMDVYEDSVKNGWSHEDTEKAYLGKRSGYKRGGMDQLQFSNPQIALGVKSAEDSGKDTGFDKTGTSLVILTGGMMRYLTTQAGPGGEEVVIPGTRPANASFKEGMGIYAVCYGVGHHSIGQGNITFTSENFSAGSELNAGITFVNTGDVSIRGSEDNPVTVTLNATGDGLISKILATWKIGQNIKSGQKVQLHGVFTLPATLPKGAEFSITVSEDATYTDSPFSATLKGIYTIEEKAELGFESSSIELSRQDNGKLTLDKNGNAILNVDLFVGNRGLKDVENAYLQFSYGAHDPVLAAKVEEVKGGESDWNDTIFSALDITGHSLKVGEEEELPVLTAVGSPEEDAKEGVLSLGRIRAGYGRHVRGTVAVKADAFAYFDEEAAGDPSGALKLAAEIFDSGEEVKKDNFNVRHADRKEYDEINNRSETLIEHTTSFIIPTKLEIPAGLRLRLPLSYSSTLGSTEPDISVMELTDCEARRTPGSGDDSPNMDQTAEVVSYEEGSYKNGYGYGTVVIRGAKEGNSYIRIQDMSTNSFKDIAVIFTAPGDGLDIESGSGLFQFQDENGKTAQANGKSWQFQNGVNAWGKSQSEPYKKTLVKGKPGMSFSFETEAETINLYFDGEVNINSDFEGFKQLKQTSDGSPKRISFGSNPSNLKHTVRVTVTGTGTGGKYADFDRLDFFYHGDRVDMSRSHDDSGISLVWASSFPAPKSLDPGQVYDATAYVIDNNTLSVNSIGFDRLFTNSDDWSVQGGNAKTLSLEQTSPRHYTWKIRFSGNGKTVLKNANNTLMTDGASLSVIYADWWKAGGEGSSSKNSPVRSYYEEKYPDIFKADTVPSTGSQAPEVIRNSWLTSSLNEDKIEVKIADNAPVDSFRIHLVDHLSYLDTLSLNREYDSIEISKGGEGNFLKKGGDQGIHVVMAEGIESRGTNDDLDYWIRRNDGRIEEYNAEDVIYRNVGVIHFNCKTADSWGLPVTVKQYLPGRQLKFASLESGSAVFLLKGGKYYCEEGLSVTSTAKGAVKVNAKSRRLTVKKDSLITLTKGNESKSVLMYAVKLKKKNVTLNSRRKSVKLSEIFTNAGELLPDVENGKFLVSVVKDKNGILKDVNIPKAEDGKYVTLDEFTVGTTGKKGSAVIMATFGGKTFKAAIKCTGYPLLPESTVSRNLVQNLKECDNAGNRVLTFDSVENGDTLLLLRKGKYALESGLGIEPVGAEYSKALKVKENRKTGVRTLSFAKEAPVKLTKDGKEKVILINLVSVKKKSVKLKHGMSCTLSDLFGEAYELLPDTQVMSPEDYAVIIDDKNGSLFIQEASFPATGKGAGKVTTLGDFTVKHSGRKGSATIQVYFGGRIIKAKVSCK
ncbi:MAG: hypothetical protein IJT00_09495 [Lachnospiraceae bacterium]|nr:hypothetical protein [Lachnospiraceae bacterium]